MISIRDLRKVYRQGEREVVALDGIDLTVPTGAVHGIIGHSGAGKSTLVRCLTLLDRPTSGSVSIDGSDLSTAADRDLLQARRRIGMVFQHANLLDSRTVLGNVAYPLEVTGQDKAARTARARELLGLVGLEDYESSYPSQLSGGQRQRVGIARALASDPRVLLCDEPTSALDPATTDGILELIRDLSDRLGLTVVVITHEMHVVKKICTSVSLLDRGRIVEGGALTEVASDLGSRLSAALLPLPEAALDTAGSLVEVLGQGPAADVPVSAVIKDRFGHGVRVLAGSVEDLAGVRFAHHLLALPDGADDRTDGTEAVVAFLEQNGYRAAQRTRTQVETAQGTAQDLGGAQ
ncbi:methionine ABC transporter ATP-binding protein [Citricoccus sp.]|uniref:methionine ABC transporter ATP-binding protein n=1 Tax=Citricoccus sp. TaxID=1978372 RepID=UPI00262DCE4A|nr:methionine ABC transporter ATP-binding protein [Citricoccus sp.]HRO31352.1 methionine ABC transporter ATP-binding protein [Citricoccus sp.]HRO93937.1 methionine ABC transporter ATP-binding protein [Citricoccus sp.]